MNHLAFLLETLMDKLPAKLVAKIWALLGKCFVEFELKSCHIVVVVVVMSPPTDKETRVDGAELGNQGEMEGKSSLVS